MIKYISDGKFIGSNGTYLIMKQNTDTQYKTSIDIYFHKVEILDTNEQTPQEIATQQMDDLTILPGTQGFIRTDVPLIPTGTELGGDIAQNSIAGAVILINQILITRPKIYCQRRH